MHPLLLRAQALAATHMPSLRRRARTYFAATTGVQTQARYSPPATPQYIVNAAGERISPWHDIPMRLARDGRPAYNFVCEVPRGSTAKLEISTTAPMNPLVHDTARRTGKPRYYPFPSMVNYGALPQTYENPVHLDALTERAGDGDPLDVCEIGARRGEVGGVYPVRIIGGLALIDGGATDWKLLAIRADDPLAATLRGGTGGREGGRG